MQGDGKRGGGDSPGGLVAGSYYLTAMTLDRRDLAYHEKPGALRKPILHLSLYQACLFNLANTLKREKKQVGEKNGGGSS